MAGIETRLAKLSTIWRVACPACLRRPVLVGVGPDEPDPVYPDRCPQCHRRLPPVVCLAGVDVDRI